MGLQGNPVAVIVHPHQIPVVCLEIHGLAGIAHIFLHKGAGAVVGLQIAPEQPLADGCLVGGESGKRPVEGLLQHVRAHFLLQQHRQPVHGREIPSLQRRVYNGGQIQLVPVFMLRFLYFFHPVLPGFHPWRSSPGLPPAVRPFSLSRPVGPCAPHLGLRFLPPC